MEELLKALAEPTRALILDELVERTGQTLFEICGRLSSKHGVNASRQAISQHLLVLEEAGLVHSERRGRYKFHYVHTAALLQITRRWPVSAETVPAPASGPQSAALTADANANPRSGATRAPSLSKRKKP